MIDIPELTPDLLAELGQELGGCDFGDADQKEFLASADACDVQAAPGSGKTTLLVAKLVLLARNWTSRSQGVCVISHTNAARDVIEKKLVSHPRAAAFLCYPNFVGTVTAFITRFLALPYLRGLGWTLARIDDDVHASAARSLYMRKPTLRVSSMANGGVRQHQVETWVSRVELARDFECVVGAPVTRLKIRHWGDRQPNAATRSGIELEELKADLVAKGLYRYGDMNALASRAIDALPALVARLRRRFPLVMLDEAQDTNGIQLELLDRVFGEGTAYQRLGDQNQRLYEDSEVPGHVPWPTYPHTVPLDKTRRFGPEIAAVASRLTVRKPQAIRGKPGEPNRRAIFLFDRDSISQVLPAYASEVKAHWGTPTPPNCDVWAVASRHRPYRDRTGDWPKSLVDYFPDYRDPSFGQGVPETLCHWFRQAAAMNEARRPPAEVMEVLTAALADVLPRCAGSTREKISARDLWTFLAADDRSKPLRVRRLLRDQVIRGEAPWMETAWPVFCRDLCSALGMGPSIEGDPFFSFQTEAHRDQPTLLNRSRNSVAYDGVLIRLGSIHSVKGRTVDSILVMETEVYRGRSLAERAMDVAQVLPHAIGLEDRDFMSSPALLTAATNIFVASTRPRQLLSFAVRKAQASEDLLRLASSQGWMVYDLTE